jgi:hypothetical protein
MAEITKSRGSEGIVAKNSTARISTLSTQPP